MLDKMALGSSIEKLRKDNNMTVLDFSNAVKISRKKIISIERGETLPSLKMVINICNYFDLNIDSFLNINNLKK